jgi:hypothetical protein
VCVCGNYCTASSLPHLPMRNSHQHCFISAGIGQLQLSYSEQQLAML